MLAGCGGNDKNVDAGQPAAAQSASAQSAQTHGKGGGLSGESAPTFSLRDLAGQQVAVETKESPMSSISGQHGAPLAKRKFRILRRSMRRTMIKWTFMPSIYKKMSSPYRSS